MLSWFPDVDHNHPDQQKRIKSACNKKMTPASIDDDVGFFAGSGKEDYRVTASSCTCSDFVRRKLPCKHMYRLAHELGWFDLSQYGNVKSGALARDATYSVDEIVSKLSEKDARLLKKALYAIVIRGDDGRELVFGSDVDVSAIVALEILREVPAVGDKPQNKKRYLLNPLFDGVLGPLYFRLRSMYPDTTKDDDLTITISLL